jgi:hypothetical protein
VIEQKAHGFLFFVAFLAAWNALHCIASKSAAGSTCRLAWLFRDCSNAQTRALSHPLPVLRAREIDRWAQSEQYRELLAANNEPTRAEPPSRSSSSTSGGAVSAGRSSGMRTVEVR